MGDRVEGEPLLPILAGAASASVLAMVLIWAVWINPINKTVNSWTSESLPSSWMKLRDRWHLLHAVRFALSVIAFTASIGGLCARTS